jgi:type II secretory pathway pseudopilin PulG
MMINFFRKIREKLLTEGKTGKYLKYAIGEIVLVMIGILLAVQVNNWNEQRKDRMQRAEFLLASVAQPQLAEAQSKYQTAKKLIAKIVETTQTEINEQ